MNDLNHDKSAAEKRPDGAQKPEYDNPACGRPFDPDSPDVTDPQIDPPHPPTPPDGDVSTEQRAPGEQYPPYSQP